MLKIYTTETCPQCKVVKSYLNALGAKFEEVLVNTPELIDEVVNLTGERRVPVIKADSQVIIGIDFNKMKEVIYG